MSFNFTEVKTERSFQKFPDDCLRLSNKNIIISANVADKLHSTRYKTEGGQIGVRLKLYFDHYSQAIKIVEDAQGFTSRAWDSGLISGNIPVNLRRAGLPVGDYKLVDGETNIFQLVR